MSVQAAESRKDEFRAYLEKNGVVDTLTKVLVGLYEEPDKPSDALDFVKRYLGAPVGVDVEQLKEDNEMLRAENEALKSEIATLKEAAQETPNKDEGKVEEEKEEEEKEEKEEEKEKEEEEEEE